ncbi:hypothetical protein AA313_de0200510 [Arthrobotrys entomopaga]|nr:hypothetical protein AA313_de0200510 [Arthrobotrys entomopaga]
MLKLTIFGTLIVAATATRSYSDRYIFYVKEPSDCGDSTTCPTSTSYKSCGTGQCTEGMCGDWFGFKNYCCSTVHGTGLSPACNDTIYTDFFAKFTGFDTAGTPAYEGGSSCPVGDDGVPGGLVGKGIKDPSGTTCCSLDKDAFVLFQNATWPYNTEGYIKKARCVDPLFPVENAQTSSSSGGGGGAPTSTPLNTQSAMSSQPTPTSGGSSPVSTSSTGATASTSPNAAASNDRFAVAAGVVPFVWLLALYF